MRILFNLLNTADQCDSLLVAVGFIVLFAKCSHVYGNKKPACSQISQLSLKLPFLVSPYKQECSQARERAKQAESILMQGLQI